MDQEIETARRTEFRSWIWLGAMTVALQLSLFPFSSYNASLSAIQSEWSLTSTEAGLLSSAFFGGYVMAALLVLPLTDRVRPVWVITACSTLAAVAHLAFPLFAHGLVLGLPLRFAAGVGMVGVYVTGTRVVAERFRQRRGTALGIYVTGFYLGGAVSLTFTGLLIAPLGWRGAYTVASIIALVTPIAAYLALRNHQPAAAYRGPARLDLRVLRNPAVAVVIGCYSLHAWELYVMRVWAPALLALVFMNHGRPSTDAIALAASVVGVLSIAGAGTTFVGGWLSDRFGRLPTAASIFAVSGACSFAIGWAVHWPVWVTILVAGIYIASIGADSAIYSTAVTEAADPRRLGSVLGLHSFIGFSAGTIAPIAFGALLDLLGRGIGWSAGFGTAGVGAVIAILAMLWLQRRTKGALRPAALSSGSADPSP